MANNTTSVNKIVSIFRDLSLRNKMVNDFGYGPTYNIGASTPMKFPYIWVEHSGAQVTKSVNGYKENIYSFNVYCLDVIDKGDSNYNEIISDTKFILDSLISELSQHKYYIDMNISLYQDITMEAMYEVTDDNVNGWMATISLKVPVRYTPCNLPIEPISGYTTELNSSITEYRLVGATGPQGPTGPTGPAGGSYTYILNEYHGFRPIINAGSGNCNNFKLQRIVIETDVIIDTIGVYNLQASAGGELLIGIWDMKKDGTKYPTDLLAVTPIIDLTLIGTKLASIPATTLAAGEYWVGYNLSPGVSINFYCWSNRMDGSRIDINNWNSGIYWNGGSVHTWDGTMPDPFPVGAGILSASNINEMAIIFRVIG